jgi:hypothetical protein
MSKLHINIGSRGLPTTVSEMRIRLARALSKLDGATEVYFDFRAEIKNYVPTGESYEDFAARCFLAGRELGGLQTGRFHSKPASLGAPYVSPHSVIAELREEEPTIVHGELARPEND